MCPCVLFPRCSLFSKAPPLLIRSLPPSHLAGSSLPEAGILSPSVWYRTNFSVSLALPCFVSTKGAKLRNLFRAPAARLCVGVDQWVFYLLAEWSSNRCSSSPGVVGRRHGPKAPEDCAVDPLNSISACSLWYFSQTKPSDITRPRQSGV
jgi:hypothetical protein